MSTEKLHEEYGIYPPNEIGDIHFSHENLLTNDIKWYNYLFWIVALFFCGYFWFFMVLNFADFEDSIISLILFFSLPVIFPLAFYFWLRRKRKKDYCVFVGSDGFAYYTVSRKNKTVKGKGVYLFHDLAWLHYSKTDNYLNGSYTGTTYVFSLHNSKETVFNGRYLPIKVLDEIEKVWTVYLWEKHKSSLLQNNHIAMEWDDYKIEIGLDYLSFNKVEFSSSDIKKYGIKNGILWIEHQNYESKYLGFKRKGNRIVFSINNLPNKQFFYFLLRYLVLHEK
jgi:hypothetical protein